MGIFSSKLNITRGKYNLSKVSGNPIQKSDVLKGAKNQALMTALFNMFDVDGGKPDGILTSYEQCRLVEVFKDLDTDHDGKLSKQEFEDGAAGTKLDGDMLRDFFKRVMKSMKRKEKVDAKEVYEFEQNIRGLNNNKKSKTENTTPEEKESTKDTPVTTKPVTEKSADKTSKEEYEAPVKPAVQEQEDNASNSRAIESQVELAGVFEEEPPVDEVQEQEQTTPKGPSAQVPEAKHTESPAVENHVQETQKPETTQKKPELHKYTVQLNETFTNIIKKSLAAQGNTNPTKAEIEAAKKEFKKNNPNAVKRTRAGYEYLLVGAQVKLAGNVENKNNAKSQIDAWSARYGNGTKKAAQKTASNAAVKEESKQTEKAADIPAPAFEVGVTASGDTLYIENNGSLKTETRYGQDGTILGTDENKYTDSGLLASKTVKDKDGNVQQTINYLYYEDGREAQRTYQDKNGNITGTVEVSYESKDNPNIVKKEFLKDTNGKPTGGVVQYKDGSLSYHFYNSDGNPINEYTMDKNGKVIKSSTNVYYENGFPQRTTYVTDKGTEIFWYNKDGSYEHSILDKNNKPIKLEYADIEDKPITKEEYLRRKPVEITK